MVGVLPETYSPTQWRHVEAVDPASQGKTGYLILAEDPQTQIWWVVMTTYIDKKYDPISIYQECQLYSQGKNILYRVADSNASWFIATAMANKCYPSYRIPHKKTSRKQELIKQVQGSLTSAVLYEQNPNNEQYKKEIRIKISDQCVQLIEELEECRWSDSTIAGGEERIVNATKYHLLDSLQYGRDVLPQPRLEPTPINYGSHGAFLRQENERRMQMEKQKQAARLRKQRLWGAR
jgi:hypothetical protein